MTLSSPQQVTARLEAIDADLAVLQNEIETAAFDWFRGKRDREQAKAEAFLTADGSVAERESKAAKLTATLFKDEEAKWEAKKAVLKTLEARATIGASLLKAQGRI